MILTISIPLPNNQVFTAVENVILNLFNSEIGILVVVVVGVGGVLWILRLILESLGIKPDLESVVNSYDDRFSKEARLRRIYMEDADEGDDFDDDGDGQWEDF